MTESERDAGDRMADVLRAAADADDALGRSFGRKLDAAHKIAHWMEMNGHGESSKQIGKFCPVGDLQGDRRRNEWTVRGGGASLN